MASTINSIIQAIVPKEFYYGWVIAAAIFLSLCLSTGTFFYAFGVFVEPLEEEFGWSRTQINASYSLAAISAFTAPIVGRLVDRYGPRPVMSTSLLVLGLSFVLRPFMTELWQWYALNIIQFIPLVGIDSAPVGKLLGLWFHRTRGRMMGITMIGYSAGGLVMPPIAAFIVTTASWQWGYGTLGILIILCAPLIFGVVRDRPEDVARAMAARRARSSQHALLLGDSVQPSVLPLHGVTVREALRSRSFYAVTVGLMAMSFTFSAVMINIVPHLENEGMTLGKATLVLSALSVFAIGGKLIGGYLSESWPIRYVVMLSLAGQIVGLIVLVVAGSSNLIWLFVPIYGLALGGVGMLHILFVQETFGLRFFGSIFGTIHIFTVVSQVAGPLMTGVYFDVTGSYRPAYLTVCVVFALSVLAINWAIPMVPDWRREPVEHQ